MKVFQIIAFFFALVKQPSRSAAIPLSSPALGSARQYAMGDGSHRVQDFRPTSEPNAPDPEVKAPRAHLANTARSFPNDSRRRAYTQQHYGGTIPPTPYISLRGPTSTSCFTKQLVHLAARTVATVDPPVEPSIPKAPQKSVHDRAHDRLGDLAILLMDSIFLCIIVVGVCFLVKFLRKNNYQLGLLAGAAMSGVVAIIVPNNSLFMGPIQLAVLLSYSIFHWGFYGLLRPAMEPLRQGFALLTATLAVILLSILSTIPAAIDLWKETTGLAGWWALMPLHLCVSIGCAYLYELLHPPSASYDLERAVGDDGHSGNTSERADFINQGSSTQGRNRNGFENTSLRRD
ncbi:hypothetical protein NX059_009860 [Plenodomus lindquistii]|nr:hypothetical protein NX059_009860 [Plenodomus lindquistii]